MEFRIKYTKYVILSVAMILIGGCGQSENTGDLVKRARLVANENLQLKEQITQQQRLIEENNKQIAELTANLEKSQQEVNGLQTKYNELDKNMNAALLDCQNALAARGEPNQPAQVVSCEELQKQYDETFKNLMQQLLECSQKLEKYEQQSKPETK